jgi:AraC family transcriptional regulator, transcriptional activator of the genes for pyochelin and ferripyochelin receptors
VTNLFIHQKDLVNTCHDRCYPLPPQKGSGYFRSVCPRKGMLLFLEEYRLKEKMSAASNNISLPLGISYCLSGQVRWTIEGGSKQYTTRRGQCELLFSNHTHGSTTYLAGEPVVIVNIMLCPKLLQSYFDAPSGPADGVDFPGLTGAAGTVTFHQQLEIPGFMRQILRQLLRAPCQRMADKLRIQSKILDLVAFQLEGLEAPEPVVSAPRESVADRSMVSRAKSILQSRIQSPPSLRDLARLLGTNKTRLKKCFPMVCGATVYGYLTVCRMQRACELLEDDDLTLSQIGAEVGYAEAAHFSRAFSRYFGLSPSQYRRRLRLLPER